MELFNSEKKKLRKKDLEAFYYDDNGNFEAVPSMFDDKLRVYPFLKCCAKRSIEDITDELIDEVWGDAEKKKDMILEALDQLKRENESTGDTFKTKAYANAIRSIKKIKVPLLSGAQAQKISGIGKGIAAKIDEILRTGKLKTLEERLESSIKRQKVVEEFLKIWGVGPAVANRWYSSGRREMADLVEEKLTEIQKVGIKYFDEIQEKIPRDEVKSIGMAIEAALKKKKSFPGFKMELAGSYRRGDALSSDIDILMAMNDGTVSKSILKKIVDILTEAGIITDAPSLGPQKFMGIAKAPVSEKHRRIDIRLIPPETWGAGILYFTGPKAFNVQMREQASQMGYRLSEKGLFKLSTISDDEGADELIKTETEEDIFRELGMKYQEPKDRT